jgi:hypothetical protein
MLAKCKGALNQYVDIGKFQGRATYAPIPALAVILHPNNARDAYKMEWEMLEVILLTTHSVLLISVRGKLEERSKIV